MFDEDLRPVQCPGAARGDPLPPKPRLFPEIWAFILSHACWSLAGLARATTINREIRASCFSTPASKCDFLVARCHGDVDRALRMLIKPYQYHMPDLIECLAVLVGRGAQHYDCNRIVRHKHSWRTCLLRGLIEREDAVAVVTICLHNEALKGHVLLNDAHRAKALQRAVDKGDVALMRVLGYKAGPRRHRPLAYTRASWWDMMIKKCAGLEIARELVKMVIGIPGGDMTDDLWGSVRACFSRGGEFIELAGEMLGENISKDVSRRVWSIVDVRDKELVAKVIRLGIKPNESTVWRYLATKGAYPKRAADDATLLEMLGAGEFEPSMLCDQYAISVYLARPQLMQDLVDAHVLYADYRDRVILQLSTCHMYQRDFATHLQKIDEFRAAGGAVTGRCILSACQSSGPDDFISGLVDRMGDALKTEDVITSLVSEVQPYPVAARATRLLLPRSFPVSLHALEVAIPIVWGNGRPEDRVDVLRDLLAHANVADLAAQDGIRKLGDSLVTKAMTSARFDLIGEANRTRLIELLVAAGFIVKEQDVAVALSKGWEQVSGALLQSVHKEGVSAVDIS